MILDAGPVPSLGVKDPYAPGWKLESADDLRGSTGPQYVLFGLSFEPGEEWGF